MLVSLATLGAAAFHEQRGFTSKAGYYKKYLSIESAVMPRWSLIPAALVGNSRRKWPRDDRIAGTVRSVGSLWVLGGCDLVGIYIADLQMARAG